MRNIYFLRGAPVTVLARWDGKGPRNVLIRHRDGRLVVRPFRGLRKTPKNLTGASPGHRLAPLYGKDNPMTKPFTAWLRPPCVSSPENAGVPVCRGFAGADRSRASRVHHEDSV